MALPLIPIISGLVSLAPTIGKWLGGSDGENAAQAVADMARSVTGINDVQGAVNEILSDPIAQLEFMKLVEKNRTRLDELYLADRQDARKMYVEQNEQADKIADRITKFNVLYIMLLVAVNCLLVYFLEGNGAVLAAASNIIGLVIRDLLAQIQAVTGFYFGSSMGSKSKDGKK